ncbi:MAG: hypothetical protein Q9211_007202, partial [Gyalolechia sp. 1 TL-2023]
SHSSPSYSWPTIRGFEFFDAVLVRDNSRLVALRPINSQVFDLKSEKPLFTFDTESSFDAVTNWCLSPGGEWFLIAGSKIGGQDGHVALLIWDAVTGRRAAGPLEQKGPINRSRFSPDGRRVVIASQDGKARVFNSSDGRSLWTIDHGDPAASVEDADFDPKGRFVVTAGSDGTTRLWDATTGKPVPPDIRHEGPVREATFSPDGESLSTISLAADHNTAVLRVWNVTAKAPRTPPVKIGARGEQGTYHAAFNPDGRLIVVASENGARVWDSATGEPVTPWFDSTQDVYRKYDDNHNDRCN